MWYDHGGMCRTEQEEIHVWELIVLLLWPQRGVTPRLQRGTNEVNEEQIDRTGNPDS